MYSSTILLTFVIYQIIYNNIILVPTIRIKIIALRVEANLVFTVV